MGQYKLAYVMYGPSEDMNDKYVAEIPALPGCRAWGDTPEETLWILEGVAQAFIDSYLEHGEPLPHGVVAAPIAAGEVTVTA